MTSTPTDAAILLADRVARLDAQPGYDDLHGDGDPDINHAVRIMQSVTPPGVVDRSQLPVTSPAVADEITDGSALLRRLRHAVPRIVDGPLDKSQQVWIATGRPAHLPPRSHDLRPSSFVPAREAEVPPGTTFGIGLHTSTRTPTSHGMWWTYLQIRRGSSLHPFPWTIWSVQANADARIFEVDSATRWVNLVRRHPRLVDGLASPDWADISRDWDAVHITLRAVVATQGVWFPCDGGLVAGLFCDVESTLWLRWTFTAVAQLQRVDR